MGMVATASKLLDRYAAAPRVAVHYGPRAPNGSVCAALRAVGYDLRRADSFRELAAWLAACPEALVLLSVPNVDSVRRMVLESITRRYPTVRIVAMTARALDELASELAQFGILHAVAENDAVDSVLQVIDAAHNAERPRPAQDD
jgi:DNA-binding NtrC family response regulator